MTEVDMDKLAAEWGLPREYLTGENTTPEDVDVLLRAQRRGRYSEGALYWRALPDGYEVTVCAMTYGKARLCFGQQRAEGYMDAFCYQDPARAIEAAKVWTGEGDPLDGWHRNPLTGRRREGGDPATEVTRA